MGWFLWNLASTNHGAAHTLLLPLALFVKLNDALNAHPLESIVVSLVNCK